MIQFTVLLLKKIVIVQPVLTVEFGLQRQLRHMQVENNENNKKINNDRGQSK